MEFWPDVVGWVLVAFTGGTWAGFRLAQRWESMKTLPDWVEKNL